MANTVAQSINLSSLGLGSGINDSSIISQLVAIQQIPLTQLQTQQSNVQSASSTITQFSSLLSSLQSAAQTLSDPLQYASFTANASSSAVVASASAGALAGTHTVSVTQLAQAQMTFSDPQTSSTSALGDSGTLDIKVGSQDVPIPVNATDSLTEIASNINSAGLPISAAVVFDGTNYRLQVQGQSTGAANAITFGESGFSLGLTKTANTYQSAQDAKAVVDGNNVTSSTNQLTGAIPGVTLALTSTTTSPISVNVSSDTSGIQSKIQAFVTAYNNVITTGHTDAGYGTTAATNSLLEADNGVETSLNRLASLVSSTVTGADSSFQDLGSVGLTVNKDGTLTFNASTFQTAVQQDPTGVEKLFVTQPSIGATGVMQTLSNAIDALATGPNSVLGSESQAFATRLKQIQANETSLQARITQYQTTMQQEFTAMDQTVNEERALFGEVGGTGSFV